jgi:hypothetical protein
MHWKVGGRLPNDEQHVSATMQRSRQAWFFEEQAGSQMLATDPHKPLSQRFSVVTKCVLS